MNLHFTCDAYFDDAAGKSFEQTFFVCSPDYGTAAQSVERQLAAQMPGSRLDELNLQTIRGELAKQAQEQSAGALGVYSYGAPRQLQP